MNALIQPSYVQPIERRGHAKKPGAEPGSFACLVLRVAVATWLPFSQELSWPLPSSQEPSLQLPSLHLLAEPWHAFLATAFFAGAFLATAFFAAAFLAGAFFAAFLTANCLPRLVGLLALFLAAAFLATAFPPFAPVASLLRRTSSRPFWPQLFRGCLLRRSFLCGLLGRSFLGRLTGSAFAHRLLRPLLCGSLPCGLLGSGLAALLAGTAFAHRLFRPRLCGSLPCGLLGSRLTALLTGSAFAHRLFRRYDLLCGSLFLCGLLCGRLRSGFFQTTITASSATPSSSSEEVRQRRFQPLHPLQSLRRDRGQVLPASPCGSPSFFAYILNTSSIPLPPAACRCPDLRLHLHAPNENRSLAEVIVAIACTQTPSNDKYVMRSLPIFVSKWLASRSPIPCVHGLSSCRRCGFRISTSGFRTVCCVVLRRGRTSFSLRCVWNRLCAGALC